MVILGVGVASSAQDVLDRVRELHAYLVSNGFTATRVEPPPADGPAYTFTWIPTSPWDQWRTNVSGLLGSLIFVLDRRISAQEIPPGMGPVPDAFPEPDAFLPVDEGEHPFVPDAIGLDPAGLRGEMGNEEAARAVLDGGNPPQGAPAASGSNPIIPSPPPFPPRITVYVTFLAAHAPRRAHAPPTQRVSEVARLGREGTPLTRSLFIHVAPMWATN